MSGMRRIRRGTVTTALVAIAVTAAGVGAPGQADPRAAGRVTVGAGDPYFPRQGNRGYDARAYRIAVRYTPATEWLAGRVTIKASATMGLDRFSLDLRRWMRVGRVEVDGRKAKFRQPARLVQKLVVTPKEPLAKKQRFTVAVRYAGTVEPVIDPDGSKDGWTPTKDGAFVASEPQGSPSWFPVNDTPKDKARFAVSVTLPKGRTALANGELRSVRRGTRRTTWSWRMAEPISSYLVTATNGVFDVSRGRTKGGVPYVIAVQPKLRKQSMPVLAKLPAMMDFFTKRFGGYPFSSTGAIVDDAPSVGYALETATKPVFDSAPDETTLAHEIAHQWYGNDVTLKRWRDIWLNEGFAEFAAWLWDEHTGGTTARQHLKRLLAEPAGSSVWNPPPANPGSGADIFADSVYERGAGTLQALRQKLGGRVFFAIMRGWIAQHEYGNATVKGFIRYAERVSDRELSRFFHRWLYAEGKPGSAKAQAASRPASRAIVRPLRALR